MAASDAHAPTAADSYRDREDHGDHSGFTAVAIRVRPLDTTGHRGECILSVDSERGEICCGKEKFCFPSVFSGEDNAQLFEALGRPLVGAALLGYNGTLMAYGQTGSGKTYTIGEACSLGTAHEGVAHRMVRDLFAEMRDDFQHRYEVSMTAVQIHLERVFDLLGGEARECGHAAHQPLPLREDRTHGPYVEGARSLPCATVDEALSHMRSASGRLAFAATQLNAHSSRSHAICQLTVTKNRAAPQRRASAGSLGGAPAGRVRSEPGPSTPQSSAARLAGAGNAAEAWRRSSAEVLSHIISTASSSQQLTECRLTLVDLAGSEDVGRAKDLSVAEGKCISTSLLTLGNVITALTHAHGGGGGHAHTHVPFRDSVLTQLLQQSLGGNCKTTVVACVSAADADIKEALSTLRFAARAKRVRVHARVNAAVEVMTNDQTQ